MQCLFVAFCQYQRRCQEGKIMFELKVMRAVCTLGFQLNLVFVAKYVFADLYQSGFGFHTNARFHQPTSQPNQRSTDSIARFFVVEILLNHDRIAEVIL